MNTHKVTFVSYSGQKRTVEVEATDYRQALLTAVEDYPEAEWFLVA